MLDWLLHASSCSPPFQLLHQVAPSYFSHLWQGFLIGLCIAIPVGPIAFLCMEYALHRGFTIAFVAALGAACADACFGSLAGLGLTLLTEWLILNSCWLQFYGGIFLCLLGLQLCFVNKQKLTFIPHDTSTLGVFGSTFLLTLANPLTILAFMALFGYFGLADLARQPRYASFAITGIFIGSLAWWTLLIYGMTRLRPYFTFQALMRFRQLGGLSLFLFGLIAILRSW